MGLHGLSHAANHYDHYSERRKLAIKDPSEKFSFKPKELLLSIIQVVILMGE